MCRQKYYSVLFLLGCFLFLFLVPVFIYSADIKAAPKSNPDTTALPSLGSPNETQPIPNWDDFDKILATLEAESAKLSAELAETSNRLTERDQQVKKLELDLQVYAIRLNSLETTINTERMGKETAIRTALERESKAIAERNLWIIGGSVLGIAGLTFFAISFIF